MGVCPLSLLCGDDYVLWKCADYSLYVWQLEMGVGGWGGGGGGGYWGYPLRMYRTSDQHYVMIITGRGVCFQAMSYSRPLNLIYEP